MNSKTTMILVVLLLAAVGGLWWLQGSTEKPSDARDEASKKLFDLTSDEVTGYEFKSDDESASSFVKDGRDWRMTAPIAGPAQSSTVTGDVSRITGLEYVKAYGPGDDPPGDDLTSLNAPNKIVKLTDENGKAHVLRIGNKQALSSRTYVRKEGDDKVYLVDADLNQTLRRKTEDYRGKRVTDFKTADAVRVEVTSEDSFTAVKQRGGWMIESPTKARADLTTLNKIINGISNLYVTKFVDDAPESLRAYGLEPPRATITVVAEKKIEPEDDTTSAPAEPKVERTKTTVAFGTAIEDKVFARLVDGESTTVFQVAKSVLDNVAPSLSDARDKRVTDLIPLRATKLTVKTAKGETLTMNRSGVDWLIASDDSVSVPETAERAAVTDLLKAVQNLKAIGFEPAGSAAFGFDAPRVRLEIEAEGRIEPIELTVGDLTPSQTGAYVRNDREDFIAVVSSADADKLVVEPVAFRNRDIARITADQVTRMSIRRPTETIALEKVDNRWRMTAPIDADANAGNVGALLGGLAALKGRAVVAKAAERSNYGLTQPQFTLEVTLTNTAGDDASPAAPETFVLYASRHDGKRYAMRADGDLIYEVEEKLVADMEREFLDVNLLSFDADNVRSLAYAGDSTFKFVREDDVWALEGESTFKVNDTVLKGVLTALSTLNALRYAAYENADLNALGLVTPELRITVEMADGTTHELRISATGPNAADRYVQVAANPGRAAVLAGTELSKIDKAVADFKR